MARFVQSDRAKIVLELGDHIYTSENPSVTISHEGFNGCMTIEARCWDVIVTKQPKESVEIGKITEHPDYDYCDCVDTWEHREAVAAADKEKGKMDILESFEQEVAAAEKAKKKAKKASKAKGRKDRFPKDGGLPVLASVPGYAKIPWTKGTLTLIASVGGKIRYAKTMEEKRDLAWVKADWILVCWPGQYTQDIFLIDDLTAFRKALGFKPVSETVKPVIQDENGEDWILDALFGTPGKKVTPQPSIINPLDYRYDGRF